MKNRLVNFFLITVILIIAFCVFHLLGGGNIFGWNLGRIK